MKIATKVDMLPEGDSTFFMAKAVGEGVVEFSKIFRKRRVTERNFTT